MPADRARPSGGPMLRGSRWGRIALLLLSILVLASIVDDARKLLTQSGGVNARDVVLVGALLTVALCLLALMRPGRLYLVPAALGLAALDGGTGLIIAAIVAFGVTSRRDRVAGLVAAVVIALWVVVIVIREPLALTAMVWGVGVAYLVGGAAGVALGVTSRRRELAEQRADDLEAQVRSTRARERSRLARELHDVVAHELTLISMQATVMRYTDDPVQRETARDAVERTSRQALSELQRLLQVLRASDVVTGDDLQSTGSPAEIADMVSRSAEELQAVGHEVEVDCRVGAVPPSTALAVDRVLREAVTNIVKHGGEGAACAISVVEHDGGLDLEVSNEVRGERVARLGSTRLGVVGLTERIELLGGRITVGGVDGRWRVRARLPIGDDRVRPSTE